MSSTTPQHDFTGTLVHHGLKLNPRSLGVLQLNITRLCNQSCVHCHVDASPRRREMMDEKTVSRCLEVLAANPDIHTLDLTGGAPELNPLFRRLVEEGRRVGRKVMVRHNLTVTLDLHPVTKQSLADLPAFFADQKVEIVSSLPYYQEYFTDKQRGGGVFNKSIESLRLLNARGFGVPGSGLVLDLVYNPVGAFLPAAQETLEADYKRELAARFGIVFNRLFVIVNMPIHRFKAQLKVLGTYEEYMDKLAQAFNPQAASGVMCRDMLSVGYDGKIYDCDFNQMLGMEVASGSQPATIFDFDREKLLARPIVFAEHCFGCTAGAGSSCGGATT